MNPKKMIVGVSSFALAFLISFANANAQILNQDLKKQYEAEKKDLSTQTPAQNQASVAAPAPAATDDGDGIEIGGPPSRENFSSLSQQDADIILEAAKSLETENPELAKKLLDIGK